MAVAEVRPWPSTSASRSRRTTMLASPLACEVGEDHGDRLAHQPAAVDGEAVVAGSVAGVLEVEQLVGGHVDGHLLVVPHPAGRRDRGLRPRRPARGRGPTLDLC